MSTLLELAPICTLLFLWSILIALGLIVLQLTIDGMNWSTELSEARLALVFDYSLIAAIITGSGMIVTGIASFVIGRIAA